MSSQSVPSRAKSSRPPRSATLITVAALVLLTLGLVGCAAGDPRFSAEAPAGFWFGIWHGMISWVTLIIGIFSDTVSVYEVDNTGGWYDFGFLLGIGLLWGGSHARRRPRACPPRSDAEWEAVSREFERKLAHKLREWAEAEPEEDWEAVVDRAEAKLKGKIRAWAAEEGAGGRLAAADDRTSRSPRSIA